jgi:hypothetical protein
MARLLTSAWVMPRIVELLLDVGCVKGHGGFLLDYEELLCFTLLEEEGRWAALPWLSAFASAMVAALRYRNFHWHIDCYTT